MGIIYLPSKSQLHRFISNGDLLLDRNRWTDTQTHTHTHTPTHTHTQTERERERERLNLILNPFRKYRVE